MLSHFKRNKCWHTVNALPVPLCPVLLSLPHMHFWAISSCCLICLRWLESHMSRENYTSWIFNPACLLLLTLSPMHLVLWKDKISVYIIQIILLSSIMQTLPVLLLTQLSFRVSFVISAILTSTNQIDPWSLWITTWKRYKIFSFCLWGPVLPVHTLILCNSKHCLNGPLLSLVSTFQSLLASLVLLCVIPQIHQMSHYTQRQLPPCRTDQINLQSIKCRRGSPSAKPHHL